MKKFLTIVLAVILAGIMALPAFAEEPAQNADDHIVVGSTTAMTGSFFTDMWGNNTSDMDVRMLLHGYNLMQWNAEIGNYSIDDSVVSGFAVADDVNGNRTYIIALYEDMFYSDGTPITAWDYAFSMLLAVSPEIAAIGGNTAAAEYVLGMNEYVSDAAETLAGVRVLNDYQLSVTVKAEYLPFFYEVALLDFNPYPISVIAPGCEVADDGNGVYIRNIDGSEEALFTADLLNTTLFAPETGYATYPSVVSGPYKLVSYDAATHTAEFEINEYYKGNSDGEKPSIEKITFTVVTNDTMIEKLESGEIDLINKVVNVDSIDAGMKLVTSEQSALTSYARSGFSFINFSCELPGTDSAAVRQAVAHLFDKDSLVSGYVRNYGVRVEGYYGIGQWMYSLVETDLVPSVVNEEGEVVEDDAAKWEELSLEGVTVYNYDVDAAVALLEGDGWTLNAAGETFDPAKDDVRCKEIDGKLVALDFELIYPEGNAVSGYLENDFVASLASAGIKLTVKAVPFNELLQIYYRQQPRECEMIYLATNFGFVFDPAAAYSLEDAEIGRSNRSGIADETLYQLAVDMRSTAPGDVYSYCSKWVEFQEQWSQILPALPVYSNVYFDFYSPSLQNYNVVDGIGWSQAIVGAYIGEAVDEPAAETAAEEDEFSE